MITRIATKSDINGILELQSLNLYANLSKVQLKDGFVTTPFAIEHIENLLSHTGVFVAEREEKIVGYIFAGSWNFFSQWDIFPYMVSRFPGLKFQRNSINPRNTFQYGPVCIDRKLRGGVAFSQLFGLMRTSFSSRYPVGVTFINQSNPRSLAAHTKRLNLEIIDEFEFNSNSYYTLAFLTSLNLL